MGTVIKLEKIYKRYYEGQENELEILHGIDLEIEDGEFVAIVGHSGAGKSTLMNIIGILDRPTEGTYILDGIDVSKAKDSELAEIRNQKIGFIFQTYNLCCIVTCQSCRRHNVSQAAKEREGCCNYDVVAASVLYHDKQKRHTHDRCGTITGNSTEGRHYRTGSKVYESQAQA